MLTLWKEISSASEPSVRLEPTILTFVVTMFVLTVGCFVSNQPRLLGAKVQAGMDENTGRYMYFINSLQSIRVLVSPYC